MKQCPKCGRSYTDRQLNFCLEDGELLLQPSVTEQNYPDDTPPTVMLNESRVTNPANWQAPVVPYQQPQVYSPDRAYSQPNQSLAITSLCLGISSVTIGWCCSLGLLLGPAALITGLIALSQTKKDPQKYAGRGLAIGGIVTGSVFLGIYLVILLIYGLAIFGSMLGGMN